jgi:hypothetical protein
MAEVRGVHRPATQGLLALVSLTSVALLTGVPLVKEGLPKTFYAVLLVLVVVCQVGQIYSHFVNQRELVALRATLRTQIGLSVKEAVRLILRDVCSGVPLLTSLDVDLSWAARVTTAEGTRLVELDWGDLGLQHLAPIDVSTRRVRIISDVPTAMRSSLGCSLFGAGDVQGATGLRFEVFYILPESVGERDGAPLGHDMLDRLTKDDLLGFLTTRLGN